MPSTRPDDKLWTPQLRPYEEDAAVVREDSFAQAFATYNAEPRTRTRTRRNPLLSLLDSVLAQPQWVQHLSDWLAYCLGGELVDKMPGDAIARSRELFLEVLWIRDQHQGGTEGEDLASNMLLKAQMQNFRTYGQMPADFCWIDDIELRESLEDDQDVGERDSDWEECTDEEEEDDPMDLDFDPGPDSRSSLEDDKDDEEPPELVSFIQSSAKRATSVLPTKSRPATLVNLDSDDLPFHWVSRMRAFFYPEDEEMPDVDEEEENLRSAVNVVDDLKQMRDLKETRWQRESFKQSLEESGLLNLMHCICRPGNLLETSHPDVMESFRWHDWKVSYAELYCRWSPATLTQEEYDRMIPVPDPHYKFTLEEAKALLQFMSDNPRMLPWSFKPMAVFLFLSQACFIANCETWLLPCLHELEYPRINGWDSVLVYRRLMALDAFTKPDSNQSLVFFNGLDPRLALIIQETSAHRSLMARAYRELFRTPFHKRPPRSDPGYESSEASDFTASDTEAESESSVPAASTKPKIKKVQKPTKPGSSCPRCAHLPMTEKCERIIYVKPRDCSQLIGAALTCAPVGDRLKPKPPAKRRKGSKPLPKRRRQIRYFHPFDDLQMKFVTYRRDVYRRCRKDINRFMWQHDGVEEMVGGVRFKAFTKKTLVQLVDNHRRVKVRAIRRRAEMEAWAYGTMTAGGSRQPKGGRKGDGYGPYSCHRGDTPDDIKALFRLAVDNDLLVEAGATIHSKMKSDLASTTRESGVNQCGRFGVSTFNCSNYISSTHIDPDAGVADLKNQVDATPITPNLKAPKRQKSKHAYVGGLYPCAQLSKKNCGPHDYNFAYARWGVVVQTRGNTVW
ncbi:hypothetical protein B0H11DRAFT_2240724 [Mycena galericulata]|nr:hypothetical protein B0H11DRAFT_2240724 [Mycena galericulata]